LGEAAHDLVLDGVVEQRVYDDDPLRGRDGPGGVLRLAEVVQIVEYLGRLSVPPGSIRRSLRLGWLLAPLCGRRRRRWWCAQVVEDRCVLSSCSRSGRGHVGVNRVR